MKKLSECKPRTRYAICPRCVEGFLDDVLYGACCPNDCGWMLEQRLTLAKARARIVECRKRKEAAR